MPPEMILQAFLDPVQPSLNVGEVVLTHSTHLPPDEEEGRKHKDAHDVQDELEVHLQKGTPLSAAPNSSVFMSSMGLAARKTGVLAPTVPAFLASSILAAYPTSCSLTMVS